MDRLRKAVARNPAIPRSLEILCIACAALAALACVPGTAGASGAGAKKAQAPGLLRAGLSQAGRNLVFTVRTAAPVALAKLVGSVLLLGYRLIYEPYG